jgi:hypothetical protein
MCFSLEGCFLLKFFKINQIKVDLDDVIFTFLLVIIFSRYAFSSTVPVLDKALSSALAAANCDNNHWYVLRSSDKDIVKERFGNVEGNIPFLTFILWRKQMLDGLVRSQKYVYVDADEFSREKVPHQGVQSYTSEELGRKEYLSQPTID